jgi:hypothetical protein
MYCYYYDYQFEEQRHESVLFPEIYVASPSVCRISNTCVSLFASLEPPTALIVVTNFQEMFLQLIFKNGYPV